MTPAPASSVQVLSDFEDGLVRRIEEWLKAEKPHDLPHVQERFRRLKSLGTAVFEYPSVRDNPLLVENLIDESRLYESLLYFSSVSSQHLLRTPTKVVAIRSYLVAKFHAFSLLNKMTNGKEEFSSPVKDIVFSVICTLMAENVYFSCLDDPGFSSYSKTKLAEDLIALWDSGTDQRSIHHLTALTSLWAARDSAPPSFGTMDGNTELLRISIDMDRDWQEFLLGESTNNETRWALEEFLFGLSYEEIKQVRTRLSRYGVSAVSYSEVRSYLDSKPAYSVVNGHDPRAIYDFYIERKDACTLRKRVSAPGPLHTIEEIYLKYRIILESS